MTEAEWLACDNPRPMLEALRGKGSDRKLRLFACACCRAAPDHIDGAKVWEAVGASERYADGLATRKDLQAARRGSSALLARYVCYLQPWHAVWGVTGVLINLAVEPLLSSINASDWFHGYFQTRQQAAGRPCPLLRCIFGNPFRPISFDPSWRTPTALKLAQAIYDGRAFDRLPILADALEEAGCADAEVLGHCRGGGDHVRGCWVLDLVLGKE
jgi:hypothetical protein